MCSREIADGVTKSAQAVQAAEAGIRQIGALARDRTVCMASYPNAFVFCNFLFLYLPEYFFSFPNTAMIQEHASRPMNSLQPVVAGAARRTSQAVGHARRTFMNIISGRELVSDEDDASDRIEI